MLTVRRFAARHAEFESAGVQPVQVFHSPAAALKDFAAGEHAVPFPVLADPQRSAYRAFGVAPSWFGLLKPAAWKHALQASREGLKPNWRDTVRDGMTGLPADFLIDAAGRIEWAHYGENFTDSLQPDAVLALLAVTGSRAP
ncbi:MAG TPA: AhpC/TSA family protein [Planctomycetota bacterium]